MLKDNIKAAREAKGLSQEELAVKLHAVRQTVSKWERGLSVPDADMLIALSKIFEMPVGTLLGENISEADGLQTNVSKDKAGGLKTDGPEVGVGDSGVKVNDFETEANDLHGNASGIEMHELRMISEKLEALNAQLAAKRRMRNRIIQGILITLCVTIVATAIVLLALGNSYAEWDYGDPETAVLGTAMHGFEWVFIRVAPVILLVAIIGIVLLRKKK